LSFEKNKRIPLIRQLIRTQAIATQKDLVMALRQNGIDATQATVSRDMKRMGLIKHSDENGIARYFLPEEQAPNNYTHRMLVNLLRDSMISLRMAQNMVIIRTLPGHAHAVASQFDGLGWIDLIGTIAGDDTVLLIAEDALQADEIAQRISRILE